MTEEKKDIVIEEVEETSLEVIVKQEQGLINFNFEELKRNVELAIKPYKNLVVTENTVDVSRKTRAKLNNLKTALNNKKIEIKKAYNEPYTKFENQMKDVMSLVEKASDDINKQIKSFEEVEKDKKQEEIAKYFLDKKLTVVPFDDFFEEQWLNKGFDKKWKKAVDEKVDRIKRDIQFLESLNAINSLHLINAYLSNGFDPIKAKETNDEYEKKLQKLESAKQETQNSEQEKQLANNSSSDTLYTRSFTVIDVTEEDLIAIEKVFEERNIKFRKVIV